MQDHFALILNEPVSRAYALRRRFDGTFLQAGKIAQVLVQYTVKLIVGAWFDARSNPDQVIDQVTKSPRSWSSRRQ